MPKFNSIIYRITGMAFLMIFITSVVLLLLANWQMTHHFSTYLQHNNGMIVSMSMGQPEEQFLSSIHESLIGVASIILILGLIGSYIFARSIAEPLQKLSRAANNVRHGQLGSTVVIHRSDELGQLADTFNEMSLELEKNEKMQKELFANIAHELRTPLTIIQGNMEGLIDDVIKPEKERFISIQDEAMRLGRLVTDLRALSLAEVHQLELVLKETDINRLLRQAISMLQPLLDEKELTVHIALDEKIPPILVDQDRINQVIYNILNNAIRYVPEKTAITVTTAIYQQDGQPWLNISISDTGNGIAADDIPYIFNTFYRSEKSRNRKSGGSGIGLALAKQFIISHGGTIGVESKIGKGTKFDICLPCTNKTTAIN